jgi:hypothetical protein
MIRLYPLPFSLETESPNSTSSTEEASQLFSIASAYPRRSPPPDGTRSGRTSLGAATYMPGAPLLHLAGHHHQPTRRSAHQYSTSPVASSNTVLLQVIWYTPFLWYICILPGFPCSWWSLSSSRWPNRLCNFVCFIVIWDFLMHV